MWKLVVVAVFVQSTYASSLTDVGVLELDLIKDLVETHGYTSSLLRDIATNLQEDGISCWGEDLDELLNMMNECMMMLNRAEVLLKPLIWTVNPCIPKHWERSPASRKFFMS